MEGFFLGLSTGLYCLGACAPVFVPYLLAEGSGGRFQARAVAEFMAGRLAAYLLFAVAVGALGARFQGLSPRLVGAVVPTGAGERDEPGIAPSASHSATQKLN